MATVAYREYRISGGRVVRWLSLGNGDVGEPYPVSGFPDRSVQVTGTQGTGGNCQLQGSNMGLADGVTPPLFGALHKVDTSTLNVGSPAASPIDTILEHCTLIRPSVTAGDGTTSYDVYLCIGNVSRSGMVD